MELVLGCCSNQADIWFKVAITSHSWQLDGFCEGILINSNKTLR